MKHAREDYNRIQDPAGLIPVDEPVFLLRGQDVIAPDMLRAYAERAIQHGRNDIARLTIEQADRMERWQLERAAKKPDLPVDDVPAVPVPDLKRENAQLRAYLRAFVRATYAHPRDCYGGQTPAQDAAGMHRVNPGFTYSFGLRELEGDDPIITGGQVMRAMELLGEHPELTPAEQAKNEQARAVLRDVQNTIALAVEALSGGEKRSSLEAVLRNLAEVEPTMEIHYGLYSRADQIKTALIYLERMHGAIPLMISGAIPNVPAATAAAEASDDPSEDEAQTFRADAKGVVWKVPTERPGSKPGETIISIGFPVCKMSEAAGDAAAEKIAVMMNRGDRAAYLFRLARRMSVAIEVRQERTPADTLVLADFASFMRRFGEIFAPVMAAKVPHASQMEAGR